MGPDWWVDALEVAEEQHDPAEWGGREWSELSADEVDRAVSEVVLGAADARRDVAKEEVGRHGSEGA